jgi:D-2-hydroxyacid dehydrogenase (NADP+)
MTNLLLVLTHASEVRNKYKETIEVLFPEVVVNVVDHHSKADPYLGSTDVLLAFGTMTSDHLVKDAPRLKWIQSLGAGTDGITDLPSLRPQVVVTSMRGIHGAAMSEAALMAMLALCRDLPRSVRAQDRHAWERWPSRLLDRATVAIFGVGVIGEALALRCKALGMRVLGITSTPRLLAGFDRMYGRDQLLAAAGEADFLVVLVPYSEGTRNAVDQRVLAAMKPSGFVINLARGGVVDEDALIEALRQRRIAGAALDVFATEPLPADHPFWDMKNVLVTGHLGGVYDRYVDDAMPIIEHNIRCFITSDLENMRNIVRH